MESARAEHFPVLITAEQIFFLVSKSETRERKFPLAINMKTCSQSHRTMRAEESRAIKGKKIMARTSECTGDYVGEETPSSLCTSRLVLLV